MRVLLIHLSDIHFSGSASSLLDRVPSIVNAVKNLDYSVESVIIAVTGDVAKSGAEEEYFSALSFFGELQSQLRAQLGSGVTEAAATPHLVIVPGNHDCDFSTPNKIRDVLLTDIIRTPSTAGDPDVANVCGSVQKNFFSFLSACAPDGLVGAPLPPSGRLFYEYNFEILGKKVHFMCCNTAWVSKLNEQQGEIIYPTNAIQPSISDASISIVLMHHPYNWLQADNARELRKRIEQTADIVLTGHEHDASRRRQVLPTGEQNTYIEGGVLEESDSNRSAFNALLIDLEETKQKAACYVWDSGYYRLSPDSSLGEEGNGLAWEELALNRQKKDEDFALAQSMVQYLDDLGVELTHRGKGTLHLSDVCIFPDLIETTPLRQSPSRVVSSREIPGVGSGRTFCLHRW